MLVYAHLCAAVACGIALLAEALHARRLFRSSRLVFGRTRPPKRAWVAAIARVAGVTAATWGVAALLVLEPRRVGPQEDADRPPSHRLVVLLDASPSMYLADAGPDGGQSRRRRAAAVLLSLLDRIPIERVPTSVVVFYSDARPVVTGTTDTAVLRNILDDLPLEQAFDAGPSELLKGVELCFELAQENPPSSTSLIILSDGDVTPATGMPDRPTAIADVLVVGVGDTRRGSFIAGRQSKQDRVALAQVARRLGGQYVDANLAPLPNALAQRWSGYGQADRTSHGELRELALLLIGIGAGTIAVVPVFLAISLSLAAKLKPGTPPRRPRNAASLRRSTS